MLSLPDVLAIPILSPKQQFFRGSENLSRLDDFVFPVMVSPYSLESTSSLPHNPALC